MAVDAAVIGDHVVQTRLNATLLAGDRLFPVTVTSLSEEGFAAEGVALEQAGSDFLVEMTLPPISDPTWSPTSPPALMRSQPQRPARVRVRAHLARLAPTGAGTALVEGLAARFEDMSETCRSTLHAWMARLAGARHPITRGIGPRIPEAPGR